MDYFGAQAIEAYVLALTPAGLLVLFITSKQVIGRLLSWAFVKQKVTAFCCECCKKTQPNNNTESVYMRVTDNDLEEPIISIDSTVVSFP